MATTHPVYRTSDISNISGWSLRHRYIKVQLYGYKAIPVASWVCRVSSCAAPASVTVSVCSLSSSLSSVDSTVGSDVSTWTTRAASVTTDSSTRAAVVSTAVAASVTSAGSSAAAAAAAHRRHNHLRFNRIVADHKQDTGGLVVWWLGRWTCDWKVAGSIPGRSAFR